MSGAPNPLIALYDCNVPQENIDYFGTLYHRTQGYLGLINQFRDSIELQNVERLQARERRAKTQHLYVVPSTNLQLSIESLQS
ncbi:hypothetical protein OCU04_004012 [Sclerotinia nivalis]|uniref:Uncharacterized protein n=1 Tax=Sclerotinia nivalis TaxID=352851 RepID=A0A9X0AT36_9HELO|nr:hypothetical protein OCU04_004012 [Sclerotinia nivalis]